MKPYNPGGHSAYQSTVIANLSNYYPDPSVHTAQTRDIMNRFYLKDLSDVDIRLADQYSKFGPKPRLPSCMLRSLLLSLEFHIPSITRWVSAMRSTPLYAILSGFDPDDTPGIGTFMDFIDRLWDSNEDNLNPHAHAPK